jgi:hypothetical protein
MFVFIKIQDGLKRKYFWISVMVQLALLKFYNNTEQKHRYNWRCFFVSK